MCEDVESMRRGRGGRIRGGRSTAVQRDKKLWDCRVERKKKKQRKQMDIEALCVCVCVCVLQLHCSGASIKDHI